MVGPKTLVPHVESMTNSHYTIALTSRFEKKLSGLDRQAAKRILVRLYGLSALEAPQARCKPLTGPLAGLWRLRVGDYRVIVDIQENNLVIVALDTDHRSQIYER